MESRLYRRAFTLVEVLLVIAVMLAVLELFSALIFWPTSMRVSATIRETKEIAALNSASSEHPVYRISAVGLDQQLWVTRGRGEVVLLDLTTGTTVDGKVPCGTEVADVSHSDDGSTSLLLGCDGAAVLYFKDRVLYRQANQPLSIKMPYLGESEVAARSSRDRAGGLSCSVSGDGNVALCLTSAGTVFGWIVGESGQEFLAYQLPAKSNYCGAWLDRMGTRLFVGCGGQRSEIVYARTGERAGEPLNLGDRCSVAAWSQDGSLLALAVGNRQLGIWDVEHGGFRIQRGFQTSKSIKAIAISRDSRWVAASVLDDRPHVILWNIETDSIRELTGHAGPIRCVAFSSKTDSLFTGSLDGSIRKWSLSTFSMERCFEDM